MERLSREIPVSATRVDVVAPRARMSAESEKLAARIERAIRRGTSDKVRELRVDVGEDGIILRGRCGTYYCKQLAQHAAMEVSGDGPPLDNRIEVY